MLIIDFFSARIHGISIACRNNDIEPAVPISIFKVFPCNLPGIYVIDSEPKVAPSVLALHNSSKALIQCKC